ncbi:Rne/Rng family ribonuclease [uncultured Corynebacterium sp.]|uniref:Rne/Rng family ribonuclease n=1 Tax=uncultured Corynebacterium sp. TaxID=159447 RepID=UPI0025F0CA2C|nr:Rne/Rng family ribonuclease [uncultured Corynebacterium sp.]
MRVHALAKAVGLTSKDLIAALGELGVAAKSAQSSVAAADRNRFLDAVVGSAGRDDASASGSAPDAAGDAGQEKNTSKKAVKSTAKKSTKKTAKKTAGKASGSASERTAKKTEPKAGAKAEAKADDAAEDKPAAKTARKSSRTTAKRGASKKAAPAKKADDVEVAETLVADAPVLDTAADTSTETTTENTGTADTSTTDTADAAESAAPKKAPRTRRRTAKRSVSKKAAPAKKADDVEVAEPIADGTAAAEEDRLVEVVPPVTPPPAESAFAIPVFIAPEPVTAGSPNSADAADAGHDGSRAGSSDDAADHADDDANDGSGDDGGVDKQDEREPRPRRRRRGRGRGRGQQGGDDNGANDDRDDRDSRDDDSRGAKNDGAKNDGAKGNGGAKNSDDRADSHDDDEPEVPVIDEPASIKGSTRLEAQRRRRADRRAESRKRHVISEAEFLARRESVERTMVVRERRRHDGHGMVTQVGVLEDDLLVEHFVTSDTQTSIIGDIYLGRVQNVLPSMEAAFIDIGTDRNGVLYSADINWKNVGLGGRSRRIEHALKAGDQVLVQATKDPIGHKGARLSMQISLAGRFLVYVPGGHSAGISRKLPEPERKRLKEILKDVTPSGSGTIIRTAAEGVSREAIAADVERLEGLWQDIDKRTREAKSRKGAKPQTMYEEPNMLVKVVRDLFNEDFSRLVVEGDAAWKTVRTYVDEVAADLADRLQRYRPEQHGGEDVFAHHRIDEQLAKALDRKVWLPSGGTLIIERTEAMTVVDVNTGKFTGAGGNLEETVTRNNLEAAEEIVRQMRLRDLGGMIVVDFIDMVLPENQDLVLRRLKEALGRDRTRHEVSEVTSLGLVQMTRKRLGTGLLETFSTTCAACEGSGVIIHVDPVDHDSEPQPDRHRGRRGQAPDKHPAVEAMHRHDDGDDKGDSRKRSDDDRKDSGAEGDSSHDDGHSSDRSDDSGRGGRRGRRGSRRGRGGSGGRDGRGQNDDSRDDNLRNNDSRDDNARGDRKRNDRNDRDQQGDRDQRDEPMSEEDRAVDESVTRAESGESRPPRRGRRRASSRGRGGSDQRDDSRGSGDGRNERNDRSDRNERSDREARDASRGNRDDHAEVGDALARVAAAAVAEARDKDPDEPSDDRYVSRSARRRRRRRVVHSDQRNDARQSQNDDRSDDSDGTDRSGDQSSKDRKSGNDDGGRKSGKDDGGRKPGNDDGARKSGRGSGDRKSGGADDRGSAAEPETYEGAKAAFEKSPRRNRPTRGRSRSDHAPKPEDFDEQGTRATNDRAKDSGSKDSGSKDSGPKGSGSKDSGPKDAGDKNTGGKGSGNKNSGGKSSGGKGSGSDDGAKSDSSSGSKPELKADSGKSDSSGRPARRGRRRAVRRVSSDAAARTDAPKAGPAAKDAPKKDAPAGDRNGGKGKDGGVAKQDDAGNKPRRGRRRAVRRRTSNN